MLRHGSLPPLTAPAPKPRKFGSLQPLPSKLAYTLGAHEKPRVRTSDNSLTLKGGSSSKAVHDFDSFVNYVRDDVKPQRCSEGHQCGILKTYQYTIEAVKELMFKYDKCGAKLLHDYIFSDRRQISQSDYTDKEIQCLWNIEAEVEEYVRRQKAGLDIYQIKQLFRTFSEIVLSEALEIPVRVGKEQEDFWSYIP